MRLKKKKKTFVGNSDSLAQTKVIHCRDWGWLSSHSKLLGGKQKYEKKCWSSPPGYFIALSMPLALFYISHFVSVALKLYPINGQIVNHFLGFLESERNCLHGCGGGGAAWRVNVRNTHLLVFITLGLCSGWNRNAKKTLQLSVGNQMFTLWSGQVTRGIIVAFGRRFTLLGYKNEWNFPILMFMESLFLI